jgi:secondary thiamine-phosphate synthase enzyme
MAEGGKATPVQKPQTRVHRLRIETHSRVEFKDVTDLIRKCIVQSQVESGVCHVFVPHTSAAVLIQENDDPALRKDLDAFLEKLAPREGNYQHNDGNCDSHLKASLIGCSKTLLVEGGDLVLGQWQGVFFCEFDGPRQRELRVKVDSDET